MIGKYKALRYIQSGRDPILGAAIVTLKKEESTNDYHWCVGCKFRSGVRLLVKCIDRADTEWFIKAAGITKFQLAETF